MDPGELTHIIKEITDILNEFDMNIVPALNQIRDRKHQLATGGEDRVKAPSTQGDHGGHLIGTQFNGSPLIDNIVAMNGNVNVSAYKKLEVSWAKALSTGKEVFVEIRPRYVGTSLRPDSFAISYKINGIEKIKILKNIYGG